MSFFHAPGRLGSTSPLHLRLLKNTIATIWLKWIRRANHTVSPDDLPRMRQAVAARSHGISWALIHKGPFFHVGGGIQAPRWGTFTRKASRKCGQENHGELYASNSRAGTLGRIALAVLLRVWGPRTARRHTNLAELGVIGGERKPRFPAAYNICDSLIALFVT